MSGSGLAAVHAAANLSGTALTPPAPPVVTPSAAAAATTTADLAAAYPDLCAAIRAEGASAERSRIAGIEAHAMAGHEKLIADMKADPNVTPDMAAGRILAAEKASRGQQLQAIVDVEKVTGKVAAAPSSAPVASSTSTEKATTPEGWRAEYAASAQLQSEFASAEDYVALRKAESAGKVRVLNSRAAS
jgi:hypothetical protein